MTTRIQKLATAISAIVLIFSTFHFATAQQDSTAAVHIGFIYPLSTNGLRAPHISNKFSLHAIAGVSRAETGVAISSVANVVKQQANGTQVAGAANVIGGNASSAQISGAVNLVKGNTSGAQVAGFLNYAENSQGMQIAGFSNITRKNAKGLQLSGFLNKAKDANVQIAGFANIAKNVRGVQFAGLINIADSSDYPIAIFNFIKSGEKTIAVTVDEMTTTIASFRSGGRVLYGIAGVGYNLRNTGQDLYAAEGGLGAHIAIANHFRINMEAVSHYLTDFKDHHYSKNTFRVLPALKIGNRLEIFAGPSINYISYDRKGDKPEFIQRYIWKNSSLKSFQGLFAGFGGGAQFVL